MEEHIVYGPIPKSDPNPTNMSLGAMIYSRLKQHGNKVAQIEPSSGRKQTYNDILNASCILATTLRSKGLHSGDVISICSENRLEFTIPVIAALYIGVVCAPLNPAYTPDELIHGLTISKPKLIFCSESTLAPICEAIRKCRFVTEVILFDDNPKSISFRVTSYSELIEPIYRSFKPDDFRPIKFDSYYQTAVVLCSSGTTGLPKGVKLSHANLETFVRAGRSTQSLSIKENDVVMGLVPFYHGYGYGMVLNCALIGVEMVVLPRFEPVAFLSSIEKYKITVLPLVPPLMVFLAKHPLVENYNLSSLHNVFVGAAPCGMNTVNEVIKRLKLEHIRQAYGMTELSIAVLISPIGSNKPGSVGILVPEAQAKVIDLKTGKSLGPTIVGELCFRGPQVMQGYYDNAAATADTIDSNGWLHTGDIGYYDSDGFFYIVDRVKELIKYKGFQVAPAELEALIISHSGVADAAVIGIPNEECGELPMAFIVKQSGATVTEQEIQQFVEKKVSPQKKLRGGVQFVSSIPRNPSGKILRRILRDGLKSKL